MIKFIFWILITLTLAYFMTDIKIGEKTLKQAIDDVVKSESGLKIRQEAKGLLNKSLNTSLQHLNGKNEKAPTPPDVGQSKSHKEEVSEDELTAQQKKQLEQIIEKHR